MTEQDSSPSLGAQAIWLLVAKTIGFAFAVALPLVLVRRMSLEQFGLYKQAFLMVNTAVNILPLGFSMSAYYFLPRLRDRQGAIVLNILLFNLVVGGTVAATLVLWPPLLANLFGSPGMVEVARPLGIVIVLWVLGSFLEIVTLALQDVRSTSSFIVASQFSKTALLLVAAAMVGTVESLIVAAIVQGVVQNAILFAYLSRRFPGFWRRFDRRLLREQATYALPLGGSSLLLRLQDDLHHIFVSHVFGPATYAVYSVGVFKLPLVGILRESVGSVVLPRINHLESRNARRQILVLVATAARKLALVYFPCYAFLITAGPDVIAFLFTPVYASAWNVFAVALTILPFGVVMMDPVTRAHEQRFFFLRLRMTLFASLATVLALFAPALGLVGVISAVVVTYIIGWSVSAFRMARLLGFTRGDVGLFRDLPRIAAAAFTAAIGCAIVRRALATEPTWLILATAAVVFAAIYIGAVLAFRILKTGELVSLWRDARTINRTRPRASTLPSPVPPQPQPSASSTG